MNFNISLLNIQSLSSTSKVSPLVSYLTLFKPDIIVLTETWSLSAEAIFSTDFSNHQCGVAILIRHKKFKVNTHPIINPDGWFIQLDLTHNFSNLSFSITCLYMPSSSHNNSIKFFNQFFQSHQFRTNHILLGDFNAVMSPQDQANCKRFHKSLADSLSTGLAYAQLSEPVSSDLPPSHTWFKSYSALVTKSKRLDRIYVTPSLLPLTPSSLINPQLSDHSPLHTSIIPQQLPCPRWTLYSPILNPFLSPFRELTVIVEWLSQAHTLDESRGLI